MRNSPSSSLRLARPPGAASGMRREDLGLDARLLDEPRSRRGGRILGNHPFCRSAAEDAVERAEAESARFPGAMQAEKSHGRPASEPWRPSWAWRASDGQAGCGLVPHPLRGRTGAFVQQGGDDLARGTIGQAFGGEGLDDLPAIVAIQCTGMPSDRLPVSEGLRRRENYVLAAPMDRQAGAASALASGKAVSLMSSSLCRGSIPAASRLFSARR